MLTRATKLGNSFSQRCEFIYFGFSYQQTGRQPLGLTDNVNVPIRQTAQINITAGFSCIREVSTPATSGCTSPRTPILYVEKSSPSASHHYIMAPGFSSCESQKARLDYPACSRPTPQCYCQSNRSTRM